MDDKIIRVKVKRKVSLVITAVDSYTDKILKGSGIFAYIPGEKLPVRKEEGYFVFLNIKNTKEVTVHLEGRFFQPKRFTIDLEASEKKPDRWNFIYKIRMTPDELYPLPKGSTVIKGKAKPDTEYFFLCESAYKPYKLLQNYNKTKSICIFHPKEYEPESSHMLIRNRMENFLDIFYVTGTEDKDKKKYFISEALSNAYTKSDTEIFPLFVCSADSKGNYYLPIPLSGNEDLRQVITLIGEENKTREFEIESGKVNEMDFAGEK